MKSAKQIEEFILTRTNACGRQERRIVDEQYIGSAFPSAGCKMADIHAIAEEVAVRIAQTLKESEIRPVLNTLWKSTASFDTLTVCLSYYYRRRNTLTLTDWKTLKTWSNTIDNWAHSDTLSGIYASLLERHPIEIYPTILTWNTSKRAWLRRLSLTSLLFYSKQRKVKPLKPAKILPLVKNLLTDPDAFVQKAVGWTLRETHNLYPKEAEAFVKRHIGALSGTAFSYATEKWSTLEKEPLKEVRKQLRKK